MLTLVEICNQIRRRKKKKKQKQQQKEHPVLTNATCTDNMELNLTSHERDSVVKPLKGNSGILSLLGSRYIVLSNSSKYYLTPTIDIYCNTLMFLSNAFFESLQNCLSKFIGHFLHNYDIIYLLSAFYTNI